MVEGKIHHQGSYRCIGREYDAPNSGYTDQIYLDEDLFDDIPDGTHVKITIEVSDE